MKLDGRRESTNVDDRRRSGGGKIAGFGLGGILIAALLTWIMGGDPLSGVLLDIHQNGEYGTCSCKSSNTQIAWNAMC